MRFKKRQHMSNKSDPFSRYKTNQFVIFKWLSYCFEETKESDVKVLFPSRPLRI